MKELSIEEKAKRYDNIIKKANKMHYDNCEACQMCIEELIPELAENEDERIRKALIRYFTLSDEHAYNEACGVSYKDIVAWLEKQGEQKTTEEYNITGIKSKHAQGKLGEMIKRKLEMEKQGEQNPTDNAEPKFKQGDWIVFNGLVLYIKQVVKGYYLTTSKGGITNGYDWNIDNAARLWTIQDAKNGDVLYALPTESNKPFIFIFDNIDALGFIKSYYKYDSEYGLKEDKHLFIGSVRGKYLPATKEQCDLLLQKMKEAGKKIYNIHAE
jgi:hypothetical protein